MEYFTAEEVAKLDPQVLDEAVDDVEGRTSWGRDAGSLFDGDQQ